ncbi:MAG: MarR family winged helix-turn-helix transcriptional regulator [Candidatus Sumerlaeaceae bacterium]
MSLRKPDISQVESLNYVFLRVMGQIFLAASGNPVFNEMTGAQKRILYFLELKGPCNMTHIAKLVGCTVPAATGVVDKLVRAGVVRREQDENDRRIIRIAMTAAGRKTLAQLKRIHEQRLQEVLERLPPERREELIDSFTRIHEILCELEDMECTRP